MVRAPTAQSGSIPIDCFSFSYIASNKAILYLLSIFWGVNHNLLVFEPIVCFAQLVIALYHYLCGYSDTSFIPIQAFPLSSSWLLAVCKKGLKKGRFYHISLTDINVYLGRQREGGFPTKECILRIRFLSWLMNSKISLHKCSTTALWYSQNASNLFRLLPTCLNQSLTW